MSTFTGWAIGEQQQHIARLNELLDEVRDGKARVRDNQALQILTGVQASLIVARTQAGDMLRHLEAAERNGEHRTHPPPLRGKMAAANDREPELTF